MYKLNYVKTSKGWTVTDEDGNQAFGRTKEAAENQYRLLYDYNKIHVVSPFTRTVNPFNGEW